MQPERGHKTFAAFWDRATRKESPRQRAARREVVGGARGRVLELGAGVGTNWQYLPDGLGFSAIEPDPFMVKRALGHAAASGREVDLRQAPAEALPFDDGTFDTVVVTLTLCTVRDLSRSLAEARRVLKPGGELRFWEHVRPAGRVRGRIFDAITPAWRRIGAGCNPNRQTVAAIQAAGFDVAVAREFGMMGAPTVVGVATRRDA
ncbi:MAG: class I SAM-dependent methyltransferase [Chloroflexi bacterium]|nr:class I SAM-dependent methyltransferase [Chloroflexota bacterium]